VTGFRSDLTTGLVQYIADAGIGEWRPDGPGFPTNFAGIALFVGDFPPAPDRVITCTLYQPSGAEDEQVTARVQFRYRGRPGDLRGCQDIGDALQDLLDERSMFRLPTGVTIAASRMASSASLGTDGSKRWSWSDNYELDADRPRTTD